MLKFFTFFDKVLIGVFRIGYILKDDPTDSFKSTRGVSWIGGPKEVHRPQADNVLLDWSFFAYQRTYRSPTGGSCSEMHKSDRNGGISKSKLIQGAYRPLLDLGCGK